MTVAPLAIYRDLGVRPWPRRPKGWCVLPASRTCGRGTGDGRSGPVVLEAQKAGIPAITVEMAGEGRALKGIIRRFETMIGNILAFFQMTPGGAEAAGEAHPF